MEVYMAPDRKDEILTAAGNCFAKFGYEKTTLDDIGELVGVNKVSLYYYFKNKEAIFVELLNREADEYGKSLHRKVDAVKRCRDKILTWIKEGFKYSTTNSSLRQFSIESLKRLTPQLEELKVNSKKKGTEYLQAILRDGQKKNEIIACDVKRVAESIQNVIYAMKDQAYQHAQSNPNYKMDIDKLVDDVVFAVSLILDGIITK
jgi:AcrR family transcriptional regulator